jgi:prepilin-type N-terminal cleavage/methylation domain-containing protein
MARHPTTIACTRPQAAFTLVEVMIAVVLSAMIVYTAVAAFRVVGQSITTSKRMSLENNLLRIGFFSVLDELDYWDLYDDRAAPDPSKNPLRADGKSFAPMTYDPTRKPSDPRTWWRGYGFGNTPATMDKWGRWHELSKSDHADEFRKWYPEQMKTFKSRLGDYGMISYARPDSIYSWYESSTLRGEPKDIWERTANTPVTITNDTSTGAYTKGARRVLVDKDARPAHWPTLSFETRRYVVWSSFIDLCQVESTNSLTGESTRLSFWGVGTTLRGARQQRLLDSVPPSALVPTPPATP